MTFSQYGTQPVGGSADIPAECQAKEDLGSPDATWIRVKERDPAIPEERSGFSDARPIVEPYYEGYGG